MPMQPDDIPAPASHLPGFYRAALDSLDACIAVLDGTGTTIAVNAALDRISALAPGSELGIGSNYLAGCEAAAAAGDERRGAIARALRELLAGGRDDFTGEYVLDPGAPAPRWFGVRASRFHGGGAGRVVLEHFDKTDFVQAQEAAQLRSQLIDRIDAAVIAADLDGHAQIWSRGAEAMFGWSAEEVLGRNVTDFLLLAHEPERGRTAIAELRKLGSRMTERELRRRSGDTFFAYMSSVVRRDERGEPAGLISVIVDTTERVRSAAELRHAREHLRALTRSMGEAMCTLDADGRVGHMNAAAEQLLGWNLEELLGRSLHDAVHYRTHDGRPYPSDKCPLVTAHRRREPVRVDDDMFVRRDGSELPVAYTSTPFDSVEGGGSVVVFTDITQAKADQRRLHGEIERLAQVRDLHEALEEERLVLHAQPIIDLSTGSIVSHELLLRMRERDGRLRSPATFLPAAEGSGLIRELDRWVIREAARLGADGHRVELNVSAASLGDPGLYDDFTAALEEFGTEPSSLVVELTETALMQEEGIGVSFMERIGALGCELALDDFGTGYGGFGYLKNLPVDYLKIDVQFVSDLRTNMASRHVVQAVVGLAEAFGNRTVAEGVEDDDTLKMIGRMGVDYAQGFGIGRPAPLEETLYRAA
jgi:PAS domain S-box-containing protein